MNYNHLQHTVSWYSREYTFNTSNKAWPIPGVHVSSRYMYVCVLCVSVWYIHVHVWYTVEDSHQLLLGGFPNDLQHTVGWYSREYTFITVDGHVTKQIHVIHSTVSDWMVC